MHACCSCQRAAQRWPTFPSSGSSVAQATAAGCALQLRRRRPRPAAAAAAPQHPPQPPPASARLQQVLDAIDALNAQDPRSTSWQGQQLPYELAYSRWLTDWVLRLAEPQQPSEELRIVARGQHVQRWKSPRADFPPGKAGYLKWREELKASHAATVTGLMEAAGYPEDSRTRVARFIMKKDLKKDPENQLVEDALVLVFLQHQFAELLEKEGGDKMVDIVRKTWAKTGPRGRAAAAALQLPPDQADVVARALA